MASTLNRAIAWLMADRAEESSARLVTGDENRADLVLANDGVRLGRRQDRALRAQIAAVAQLSVRKAAAAVGCSVTTIQRCRRQPKTVG